MSEYDQYIPNAASKKPTAKPGWLPSALRQAGRAITNVTSKVPAKNLGDLMDYQRAAGQEAIFHGGSSDANRAMLRQVLAATPPQAGMYDIPRLLAKNYDAIGKLSIPTPNVGDGKQGVPIGHAIQGAFDSALDYFTDPLTLETLGLGPGLKVAVKYGGPVLAKGAELGLGAARRLAPQTTMALTHHAGQLASGAQQIANAAGDLYGDTFRYGHNAVKAVGRGNTDVAIAEMGRQQAREAELFRRLQAIDAENMKGLTPRQVSQVQRVLHGDLSLDQIGSSEGRSAVAKAVAGRKTLTNAIHQMQEIGPQNLSQIPQQLRPFAGTPGSIAIPYRENYFPGRGLAEEVNSNRPARELNLLDYKNPHAMVQAPFKIGRNEGDKFEQAFQGMLQTSARAITGNELRTALETHFKGQIPSEIIDLFGKKIPATGDMRSAGQIVGDAIKGFVNLPKVAVVGTSPMHMVNILSLLANAGPETIPRATQRLATVLGMSPEQRFAYLKPAIDMGLYHAGQGGGALTHLPGVKQMNDTTWLWDTVAKWSLADSIAAAKKMDPRAAGQVANRLLVDYEHTSKATKALQYVMPFATFWSQVPGAVLHGAARNPAVTNVVNRATGGRLLGGGDRNTGEYYGPTAAVGRVFNADDAQHGYLKGAASYVRKGLSEPLRAAASAVDKSHFMTYGKSPLDPSYLRSAAINMLPIPYGRDVLETTGGGMFKPESPLQAGVFGATGFALPKNARLPSNSSKSEYDQYLPKKPTSAASGGKNEYDQYLPKGQP